MGVRKLIQGRINYTINSSLGSQSKKLEQGWGRGRSIHVRWQCQSRRAERYQVGCHCDLPQAEERRPDSSPTLETFAEHLLELLVLLYRRSACVKCFHVSHLNISILIHWCGLRKC